jgi:hypothetical protein
MRTDGRALKECLVARRALWEGLTGSTANAMVVRADFGCGQVGIATVLSNSRQVTQSILFLHLSAA